MIDHPVAADDTARQQALDISQSFIVQAPAGSGKTELLTQRFLALLSLVEYPEEVWAITFTRKAAAEMRRRIFVALENAMGTEPPEPHRKRTWELAKAVVRRNEKLGWELGVNPSRLQIFTIDSVCSKLVRQMPVLSGFGTIPNVANFPERLYSQASRRTLQSLHDGGQAAVYSHILLTHLDNNSELAEEMLSNMLASRDRWLPHVAGQNRPELSREALEEALTHSVNMQLRKLGSSIPDHMYEELLALLEFACTHDLPEDSAIKNCEGMDAVPRAEQQHLPRWQGIHELLMTKSNQLRKSVTARLGFPAKGSTKNTQDQALRIEMKQRAVTFIQSLENYPEFVDALRQVNSLPATQYTKDQWQVFLALQYLLQVAVAHLRLLFQETGEVDYTEVSHRALTALGTQDNPTDLALHLDYRLKHLLVDEFQDTARSQFDLVKGLTNGWQPNDGRTLFLVGDPMQSIYRFREANVGLFLQARDHGIGEIKPAFLQLKSNFRSGRSLVDWCNNIFVNAFPADDNIDLGAVQFADAEAMIDDADGAAVELHSIPFQSDFMEPDMVARLIRKQQEENPDASIAVLVRARSHLRRILPAMRAAGIRYRAVDLESLREQPVVRDLVALTRAMLHLGDRTSWLTILRAPWCGLTLNDLHALAGSNSELTCWELIVNESRRNSLSNDGQIRLNRIKGVLAKSLAERGRRTLRRWIQGTWTALGGPACIFNRAEQQNAEAFFRLLEQVDADGFSDDVDYLNDIINHLNASDDKNADSNVQVMTIHKAKGLEFDTVIIPGTEKRPPAAKPVLLRWLEATHDDGERRLLLAPISAKGTEDSIHKYMTRLDASMSRLEDVRLFYVAATRARHNLHLIGSFDLDSDEQVRPPAKGSFLSFIWHAVAEQMSDPGSFCREETEITMARPTLDPNIRPLYRVPSEWMLPDAPHPKPWRSRIASGVDNEQVEFSWASETARHIGTVVHRILQQIAQDGIATWTEQWSDTLNEYLQQMLRMIGVPASEIADAASRCENAIRNTLSDRRGQWILQQHKDAQNELPVSSWFDNQVQNVILDRTFLHEGYRWVIDYKTGSHEGGTVDAFLDSELERYQKQLDKYARVMYRLDRTPVKLGLYFPMLQGWREWQYSPN